MIEIRWHARAGQGAKTAAQLLAEAALRSGKSAQAFPEYGPERRGAPMRAYTRVDDRAIRRHDAVTRPNIVVVLEPSLAGEIDVAEGLADDGVVLVNAAEPPAELCGVRVVCVPAQGNVNVTLAGRSRSAGGHTAGAGHGCCSRAARQEGVQGRAPRRRRRGVPMPELKTWEELTVGGAVVASDAVQPETGGWRTGLKPSADLSACVNCLLCWL
jgi:pyruvate ferredoxin oxidoreductase gamma subunit